MLRALIHRPWGMDTYGAFSQSQRVSMCNYWANRLCCRPPTGPCRSRGMGYCATPFEHIYRHHRRYRITEGAEEIQMRRVAGYVRLHVPDRAQGGSHRHDQRRRGVDEGPGTGAAVEPFAGQVYFS